MNEPTDPNPLPGPPPEPERIPPDLGDEPEPLPVVRPVRKKGWPSVAWVVIVLLVGAVFLRTARHQQEEAEAPAPVEQQLDDVGRRLEGLFVIGELDVAREVGVEFPEEERKRLLKQVESLNTGPVRQRLQFIVVAGEVGGPKAALQRADELEQLLAKGEEGLHATAEQTAVLRVLRLLYTDYSHLHFSGPSLSKKDRALLAERLGWFGELALAPHGLDVPAWRFVPAAGAAGAAALEDSWTPDPAARRGLLEEARETFFGMLIGVGGFMALALVGLVALIWFLSLAFLGKLSGGLGCGSAHGGVYAETFALWLLAFLGLSLAAHYLLPEAALLGSAAAMFLSLLVLGWPVLRGIPWATVRQDVGWTLGRQPALEPFLGVGCYVMGLPLLVVGVLLMLFLMLLERGLGEALGGGDPGSPLSRSAHPIVHYLMHSDWTERLQIFLLASVAAPIVEETMFRGVLYRHLREASCYTPYVFSVLFSATVANFIFAAIHPQGFVGIPPLMALAYGFTLAREWRGTLIPCIIGHALNNGLVMLLCMFVLGNA